jgi:anaerobic selenocysteine-containing dehydrogenase
VERTYEKKPFNTPSGKVELKSLVFERYKDSHGYEGLPVYHDYRVETKVDKEEYPLILSTGSRKPQFFHARVYRMPWLANIEDAPLVDIHPEDAKKYGIEEGDCVKVTSPEGEIVGIGSCNVTGKPGIVYIYHGNSKGDANELIGKDYLDPISGFPGYKGYFCKVEKVEKDESNI